MNKNGGRTMSSSSPVSKKSQSKWQIATLRSPLQWSISHQALKDGKRLFSNQTTLKSRVTCVCSCINVHYLYHLDHSRLQLFFRLSQLFCLFGPLSHSLQPILELTIICSHQFNALNHVNILMSYQNVDIVFFAFFKICKLKGHIVYLYSYTLGHCRCTNL